MIVEFIVRMIVEMKVMKNLDSVITKKKLL